MSLAGLFQVVQHTNFLPLPTSIGPTRPFLPWPLLVTTRLPWDIMIRKYDTYVVIDTTLLIIVIINFVDIEVMHTHGHACFCGRYYVVILKIGMLV